MPNGKGYKNRPEEYYQPAKVEKRDANENGDGHEFNSKAKVGNKESCYHDYSSGAYGNFADKDASMAYLKERGEKGQRVINYHGTNEESRMHTHNIGQTAYNSKPIPETYKPATSQHEPPAEAVEYKTTKKERGV